MGLHRAMSACLIIVLCVASASAFSLSVIRPFHRIIIRPSKVFLSASSNPWSAFLEWQKQAVSGSTTVKGAISAETELKAEELRALDTEIDNAKAILNSAAETRTGDSDEVVNNLLELEQLMRKRQKLDDTTSLETKKFLNGSWRLVFTTGTIDTQKKIKGRINYFPIKSVQSFNTETMKISNGIYLGSFAVLKFFGDFDWKEKPRKVITSTALIWT